MNKKYTEETLRGKKYNALTFLSIDHYDTHTSAICRWKCDCGKEIFARAYEVIRGRKKSCDCRMYRKGSRSHEWTGYEEIPGSYWNSVKQNAKTRNLKLRITIKDGWTIFLKQGRKCALTGEIIQFASMTKAKDGTASLDRIDSDKHYTLDNVQWVHKNVNNMKKGLSESEFITWCCKVSKHQVLKK